MKLLDRIRDFATTDAFMILCLLLAYGSVVFDIPAVGIGIMSVFLCVLFLITDDILLPMAPLLLLCCLAFLCTEQLYLLWLLIPLVGTLAYRFIRNLRLSRQAKHFYSLPAIIAVAVAVTLSGLFAMSPADYFQPIPLVNVLCIGIFMIPIYLFFKGGMVCRRSYDVADKVASIMYLLGMFLAFMILRLFLVHPELWDAENVALALSSIAWWRNGAATLTVMALPFVFYYAVQHHPLHLFSAAVIYGAAVLSGSRGALVCGGIQVLFCLIYFCHHRKKARLIVSFVLLGCAALALIFHRQLWDLAHHLLRLKLDLDLLMQEPRALLVFRSFEDFIRYPIFGTGFGYTGNYDICVLVVNWYHSLLPQIIGGMGVVGILAYGYQFYLRLRLMCTAPRTPYMGALILGYLGIFIYSQIDPGLMTPYAIVATAFFALMEEETHPAPLILRKRKKQEEA